MASKVTERREARVTSIVATAWELAREHGIAGLSLHALAREVGIRQPSLYEYFASKHALHDAMFADGNRQLLERLDAIKLPGEPRAAAKKYMNTFSTFALEDPARCELLFQRHVPGFGPSPESLRASPRKHWAARSRCCTKLGSRTRATSTASWPWSEASSKRN